MKIGDFIIDHNDKQWIIYEIDQSTYHTKHLLIYTLDFETQKNQKIMLEGEIKEIVPKPLNVEFMIFHWREKELTDVKEYV
jgi:hypothetical protein